MADTISTKRDYRDDARPLFDDMRRVLERLLEDEGLQTHMGIDLARGGHDMELLQLDGS